MQQYKSTIDTYQIKKVASDIPKAKILSSKDAYEYIRQFYHDDIEIYESFYILLLNRVNNTIGYVKISQGGVTGTVVDIKIIMKYVIDSFAHGLILAHNHPSQSTNPSKQDIDLTKRIKQALSFVETTLLDHIILSKDNHYSFADNGEI